MGDGGLQVKAPVGIDCQLFFGRINVVGQTSLFVHGHFCLGMTLHMFLEAHSQTFDLTPGLISMV